MRRLCLLMMLLFVASPARAEPVTADISNHFVAITTGFTGTKLLVFGAMKNRADVAVVIEGPPVRSTVWRKKRNFGIWLNAAPVEFEPVPGFYAIASSQPLTGVADEVLTHNGLSLAKMAFPVGKGEASDAGYRMAFIAEQQKKGLYQELPVSVKIMEDKLFRADFELPASMPVGTYKAHIFLMRGGVVTGTETMPFMVAQVGFVAHLYELAQRHSFVYALMALGLAIGLSGGSTFLFRRS